MRYPLWPFPVDAIEKTVAGAKQFLAVEMSMGQMVDDVRLAVNGRKPVSFFGRTGGIIPTPAEVLGEIKKLAGKEYKVVEQKRFQVLRPKSACIFERGKL